MQVNTFCHGDRRSEPAALTRRPRGVSATNAMRSRVIPATASIRRHPLSVRVECLITLYLRVTVTRFWRTFWAQVIHFVATRDLSPSALGITSVRSLGLIV